MQISFSTLNSVEIDWRLEIINLIDETSQWFVLCPSCSDYGLESESVKDHAPKIFCAKFRSHTITAIYEQFLSYQCYNLEQKQKDKN